jgi:SAM-dependent methyltransferase
LVASCGSGIDVFYLKKFYDAKYCVSDISENAVKTAQKTFESIEGFVEDNESMSLADDTFDYSFIAASLHHLPRPLKGLYELLRVARYGLIVIEPNDSWVCRIATSLKLAREYEESGNYVYRLGKRDVAKIAKALFCKYDCTRCFATHRVAKNSLEFNLLKLINGTCNLLIPAEGNYIIFFIEKN